MILPTNDVSDVHFNIVNYYRKVVERMPVGANQHKVFDVSVVTFL